MFSKKFGREYKLLSDFVSKQIRKTKKKHYDNVFDDNGNILRQTWKIINKVLSKTENRIRLEIKFLGKYIRS